MPKTINLTALKTRSISSINHATARYDTAKENGQSYSLVRWIAKMTAVEIHAAWERYVEERLVTALNHDAKYFIQENELVGIKRVSSGFASYVVRGGGKYFDFRSMRDLVGKTDKLLGKPDNPFRGLSNADRNYIDALSAIRNCVVHRSSSSEASYKNEIRSVYNIKSAPQPDEFLDALDKRPTSHARNKPRLIGLSLVVIQAIKNT